MPVAPRFRNGTMAATVVVPRSRTGPWLINDASNQTMLSIKFEVLKSGEGNIDRKPYLRFEFRDGASNELSAQSFVFDRMKLASFLDQIESAIGIKINDLANGSRLTAAMFDYLNRSSATELAAKPVRTLLSWFNPTTKPPVPGQARV